jgi:polyphosphate kinase
VIRIRSIIGRFLEHSRILYFDAGHTDPLDGEFFIGSADWMTRNQSDRVEVVVPVSSRSARERLWEILDVGLRDRRQAWQMDADGNYTQLRPTASAEGPESLGSQRTLMDLTRQQLSQDL